MRKLILLVSFVLFVLFTNLFGEVSYHTYKENFMSLPKGGEEPIIAFEDLINSHRLVSVTCKDGFNIKRFYYNNGCWINGIGKIRNGKPYEITVMNYNRSDFVSDVVKLDVDRNPTTIIVDIEGTGDYTTIQEGIDNSQDGDVVLVYPGRYIENVNFNGHSITLASLELTTGNEVYIDSTIIDGNRAGSCVTVLNNEDALIRGFTITNGKGTEWPNDESRGGGILASNWYGDDTEVDVINCIITDNKAASGGGGIYAGGIPHNIFKITLSGVTVRNNHARVGGGIYEYSAKPIFDSDNLCNIYNNHAGIGQDICASDTCHVHIVVDTFTVLEPEGYFTEYIPNYGTSGEFSFDIQNSWMEEINHDLYVSPNGDDSNSGLFQDDPLKTIALATYRIASDSLNPKTVHVAEGEYSQALNDQIYPISFKSNTSLVGENIDTKIIGDESFYKYIIMIQNEKEDVLIKNISFEDTESYESAINNSIDNINITFENLQFNDMIFNYGSAIHTYFADSVLYKNILLNNNESNDVCCIHHDKNNAKLENCVFTNNYSHGDFSFTNLKMGITEWARINNCIFSNNSNNNDEIILAVIAYWDFCEPTYIINNCLIIDNYTPAMSIFGCGTPPDNGYISISNCTFANNEASTAALDLVGTINFSNNIMWNDTPYEIFLWDVSGYGYISTLNLQYNDIKDSIDGVWNQNGANIVHWLDGNIGADPQFTGTGDYPYYLSSTSPCIDAGTPDTTGLHLPWLDVAGNPRVYGGRIDMGALEWQGYSVDPDTNVVNNLYFFKNTPNPFKDQTTISFTSLDYDRVREYTLSIYNSRGQLVRRFYGPDEHFWAINEIVWDGKDMDGNITAPGVYFYSLEFEDTAIVRKMVKLTSP
jgi:hypothetical protein